MKKKIIAITILLLVLLLSCKDKQETSNNHSALKAPQSTPALKSALQSGKKTLIFFLNPNGAPCKQQLSELEGVRVKFKDSVNFVELRTTDPGYRKPFSEYGIQRIPLIMVADKDGLLAKVFPPGVQPASRIEQILNSVK